MSLQYAILGLLSYDSMTGYDLKKMFDESINNFWAAGMSQIYRELGALEGKGYLTSVIRQQQDRPDKRIYSITEEGRAAFRKWITNFPEKLSKEKRDEFTLRIFFGSSLSNRQLLEQFRRFVQEKQRQLDEVKSLYGMSEKYVEQLKLFNREEIYWRFVLRRAQLSLEMLMVWANECMDELNRQIEEEDKV